MCVYLYIHNKYTQYTQIYYAQIFFILAMINPNESLPSTISIIFRAVNRFKYLIAINHMIVMS